MLTTTSESQMRQTFATNLRAALERKGWTQGDLCRMLWQKDTMNERTKVNRWCTARNTPTLAEVREIASVLKVSVVWLISPAENKQTTS